MTCARYVLIGIKYIPEVWAAREIAMLCSGFASGSVVSWFMACCNELCIHAYELLLIWLSSFCLLLHLL